MESDNAIPSNKQFEKVCRTCFSKDNLVDFIDETNDYYELSYLSMFIKYLNIEVDISDSMNKICVNCLECLQIVHVFVTTSKKAERCMQSAIDNNIIVLRPALEEDDDYINFNGIKNMLQFKKEQTNKFFDDIELVLHPPIIQINNINNTVDETVIKKLTYRNIDISEAFAPKTEAQLEKIREIELELNTYYAKLKKLKRKDLIPNFVRHKPNAVECRTKILDFIHDIDSTSVKDCNILQNISNQECMMNKFVYTSNTVNSKQDVSKKLIEVKVSKEIKNIVPQFKCTKCSLVFAKKSELIAHELTHVTHVNSCKHCNITFNSYVLRQQHFRKYHLFECRMCPKVVKFELAEQLAKHRRELHVICEVYACKHCNITFNSNVLRQQHFQKYHIFKCRKCPKVIKFELAEQLAEHRREFHAIECTLCNLKFLQLSELKAHRRLEHPRQEENVYVVCEICGSYMTRYKLIKHMRLKHTTYPPLLCEDCGKYFNGPQRLRHHRKTLHPVLAPGETLPVHECTVCNQVLKSRKGLLKHNVLMHAINKIVIRCNICYLIFQDAAQLHKHMALHTGIRPYACEQCDATYIRKEFLEIHVRKMHNLVKESQQCTICDRKFIHKHQLVDHLARVHSVTLEGGESKKFPCFHCHRKLATALSRVNHINIVHSKDLTCKVCDKRMSSMPKLRAHMEYHTGVFTYNCPVCQRGFAYKTAYANHMRRHNGEHQYICKVCGKGFFESAAIRHHERVHTKEKPFACDICGKEFGYKYYMKKHRASHMEQIEQCNGCNAKFSSADAKCEHMASCLLVSTESDMSISESSSSILMQH